MPMAAMVEMNVIVMERLTSPSSSSVQKLEPIPPGHTPITSRPNPLRSSSINSLANPKENCRQKEKDNLLFD